MACDLKVESGQSITKQDLGYISNQDDIIPKKETVDLFQQVSHCLWSGVHSLFKEMFIRKPAAQNMFKNVYYSAMTPDTSIVLSDWQITDKLRQGTE